MNEVIRVTVIALSRWASIISMAEEMEKKSGLRSEDFNSISYCSDEGTYLVLRFFALNLLMLVTYRRCYLSHKQYHGVAIAHDYTPNLRNACCFLICGQTQHTIWHSRIQKAERCVM